MNHINKIIVGMTTFFIITLAQADVTTDKDKELILKPTEGSKTCWCFLENDSDQNSSEVKKCKGETQDYDVTCVPPPDKIQISYYVKNPFLTKLLAFKEVGARIPGIKIIQEEKKKNCIGKSSILPGQTCYLTLEITPKDLEHNVTGGPVIEDDLYEVLAVPEWFHKLDLEIRKNQPIEEFTIDASAGNGGKISPSGEITHIKKGTNFTFHAIPDKFYGVEDWTLDGKIVTEAHLKAGYALGVFANHKVHVTFNKINLKPNIASLALSVACSSDNPDCAVVNPALIGNPREVKIANLGSVNATNISVTSSGLPEGTHFKTNCSGDLHPNEACSITVIPGPVATQDVEGSACTSGTKPEPGKLIIAADNNFSTEVRVLVLGYGCNYQGGYIYSIDDEPNQNLRGKVASHVDQATSKEHGGIIWSTNGLGNHPYYVDLAVLGVNELSEKPCNGHADGKCNSNHIQKHYKNHNLSFYAVGLCKQYIDEEKHSDWYLPAVCELGYGLECAKCGSAQSPTLQNIRSNLADRGIGGLEGFYWSSSEHSLFPLLNAWYQCFAANHEDKDCPSQLYDSKSNQFGVRCSRDFTA